LEALLVNGVDEKKRIIGASAPHPILHNVSMEMIERFCTQVSPINVQFESDLDLIRRAVWSCYQEAPVEFRGYQLSDPGAYPEPAMSGEITWRVTSPFGSPLEEAEEAAREKALELIERLKARNKGPGS
jgi:tetrahydromethanopterin S-methyltransferase subunit A